MYKQIYPTDGIWDGSWKMINEADPVPDGYTDIQPFSPCYKLKFEDGAWVETADQDYIDSVTPKDEPEPTPEQLMIAQMTLKIAKLEAKNE